MIKKINTNIEKLFDASNNNALFEEIKKNFNLTADNKQLENMSYIFTSKIKKSELSLFFSQLSSFFEVGFLFEKTSSVPSQVIQFFAYSMQFVNSDVNLVQLPKPKLFNILQTPTPSFLEKLNLKNLDQQNLLSSFLIRISDVHTFVLMSGLADPWLKLRLEALQNMLMKIQFEE